MELVSFLRDQGKPIFDEELVRFTEEGPEFSEESDGEVDEMFDPAVAIVAETRNASISFTGRGIVIPPFTPPSIPNLAFPHHITSIMTFSSYIGIPISYSDSHAFLATYNRLDSRFCGSFDDRCRWKCAEIFDSFF